MRKQNFEMDFGSPRRERRAIFGRKDDYQGKRSFADEREVNGREAKTRRLKEFVSRF